MHKAAISLSLQDILPEQVEHWEAFLAAQCEALKELGITLHYRRLQEPVPAVQKAELTLDVRGPEVALLQQAESSLRHFFRGFREREEGLVETVMECVQRTYGPDKMLAQLSRAMQPAHDAGLALVA